MMGGRTTTRHRQQCFLSFHGAFYFSTLPLSLSLIPSRHTKRHTNSSSDYSGRVCVDFELVLGWVFQWVWVDIELGLGWVFQWILLFLGWVFQWQQALYGSGDDDGFDLGLSLILGLG